MTSLTLSASEIGSRGRFVTRLLSAGICCIAIGAAPTTLPTQMGQWWQARGDRHLSARTTLRGDITRPAILWKHRVAARDTIFAAELRDERREVQLPAADLSPAGQSRERLLADLGAAERWRDVDGTSERIYQPIIPYNNKIGKILANVSGEQWIACEPLNYPDREPYQGMVRLKIRRDGQWVDKWKTITESLIWSAEPTFGDFDRDGRNEIALLPWYQLTLLDAETGKLKERAPFKLETESPELGGRAYGWFGAVDLDAQGRDEFVIIDDFVHHMVVMGWRDGKLQRLWSWTIHKAGEHLPGAAETVAVIVNPEPVQDVDRDGRREIILSVFNHRRDQRWHTLVIEGMTGKVRHDLQGWFLAGARDLNGDGAAELLCAETSKGLRRPEPTTLAAYSLVESGAPRPIWREENAGFQMADLPELPPSVNSGAAEPRRTALCGTIDSNGRPVFFTRKQVDAAAGRIELTAWSSRGAGFTLEPIARVSGPRVEALAVRGWSAVADAPAITLRASTLDGETGSVTANGLEPRPIFCGLVPAPMSPAVVGRLLAGARPTVLVQGANETIEAIRPRSDGSVQRLWRVPGRAATSNSANVNEGVVLADLSGDGGLCAVIGMRGGGDCARIAVLDAEGKTLWHRDFDEFPGDPPPWNVPGLIYWQAGYFRDAKHMDLLVQLRRIGGETWMLDGRTGEPKWFRSHSTDEREFGRAWFTIFDYDGNGLEDVLTNYPDVFCVADGATGALLLKKHARDFAHGLGYYGWSVAVDLVAEGREQMLYAYPHAMALLRVDGSVVWKTSFDLNDPCYPHFGSDVRIVPGDADGDGKLEIFVPGALCAGKRELHCVDAATGKAKWRIALPPEKPTDPAVADIDGDGRDECLFTIASTLYSVGALPDGSAGAIEWSLPLPNYTSSVAVADVFGDGKAQIVLSCQDGYVYGIGAAQP